MRELKKDQVFRGDYLLDDLEVCFSTGMPHNRFGKTFKKEKWLKSWWVFQEKLLLIKRLQQLNEASFELIKESFDFLKSLGIPPYSSKLSFLYAITLETYFEGEKTTAQKFVSKGICQDLRKDNFSPSASLHLRHFRCFRESSRDKYITHSMPQEWIKLFQGKHIELYHSKTTIDVFPENLPEIFSEAYLKSDAEKLFSLLAKCDSSKAQLLFWMILCIEPEKKSALIRKMRTRSYDFRDDIRAWDSALKFAKAEKNFQGLIFLVDLIRQIGRFKNENLVSLFFYAAILQLFKENRIDKKYNNFYEKWLSIYSNMCMNFSNKECWDFLYLNLDTHYQKIEPSRKVSSITYRFLAHFGKDKVHQLMHREGLKRFSPDLKKSFLLFITQEFSSLRGPFMKVGQQCSYFGLPLGKQVEEELSDLQNSCNILPFNQIEAILDKAIPNWKSVFQHFEPKAFASGSTSQVHRATLRNGEKVAVKILYPNIESLVNQDLNTLRSLIPILKVFLPSLDLISIYHEIKKNMSIELNLLNEVTAQKNFAKIYNNDPIIQIPRVFEDLSSQNIMVSQYIEGMQPKKYFQTAHDYQKRKIAESICKFTVTSCCHGYFNSDPHPGNYLIKDNQLWILDFGSVKKWDESNRVAWRATIEAGFSGDKQLFEEFFCNIMTLKKKSGGSIQTFFETLKNRSMKFTQKDSLHKFSFEVLHKEFLDFFGPSNPNFRKMNINPEFLLGFRVYFGLVAILSLSDTPINSHEVVRNALLETSTRKAI